MRDDEVISAAGRAWPGYDLHRHPAFSALIMQETAEFAGSTARNFALSSSPLLRFANPTWFLNLARRLLPWLSAASVLYCLGSLRGLL